MDSHHVSGVCGESTRLTAGFSQFGDLEGCAVTSQAGSVERCEILRKENQLWEIVWPISVSVIFVSTRWLLSCIV